MLNNEAFRRARAETGLSQTKLAAEADVSIGQYRLFEQGRVASCRASTLWRLYRTYQRLGADVRLEAFFVDSAA